MQIENLKQTFTKKTQDNPQSGFGSLKDIISDFVEKQKDNSEVFLEKKKGFLKNVLKSKNAKRR